MDPVVIISVALSPGWRRYGPVAYVAGCPWGTMHYLRGVVPPEPPLITWQVVHVRKIKDKNCLIQTPYLLFLINKNEVFSSLIRRLFLYIYYIHHPPSDKTMLENIITHLG
jgi:hypothetical protein